MHGLLIHQAYVSPGEPGGTRHHELARRFVKHGHQFTIVASRVSYLTGHVVEDGADQLAGDGEEGLHVVRAYAPAVLHKSYLWRAIAFLCFMVSSVWKALQAGRVDLVIGTSPPLFQAVSAWAVARIRGCPFLLEIRDLWPEFAVECGVLRNRWLIWLARKLEHFLYARADHLLVNSPAYRDYLISHGVPEDKISFIPNGVDVAMFAGAGNRQTIRSEFSLEDKFVVTYAGAIGLANDIDTLLQAAAELREQPDIHFLIVGDGKERPRLQLELQRLGLTNVTFAGSRAKSEMTGVLAAADVCLAILKDIPMFRTTYPNKVFDYMAAGKPTVLAIDGVIRQVVEAAGGGLAVPPGDARALADAVLRLSRQPSEARAMGEAAREYVTRHFDRNSQALQFVQVCDRVAMKRAA